MTNYSTGHTAEEYAAKYLQKQGYKIVALNWKTKYCEIDILAQKKKRIYFIEVKYRQSDSQGTGLEYITDKKLKRMRFAAEIWVLENNWKNDYTLGAIEMTGSNYDVVQFLIDLL